MKQFNLLVVSTLLLTSTTLHAADAPRPSRPNIVFVMADDLGYSDLGCYGSEIPTPHIDALAANGVRFTQFYNNAVCGPSRASLLTGLYCQRIGHSGRHWNEPTDFSHCVSFGNLLQGAGYRTLMIGKWQERQLPGQHGFDRFYGKKSGGQTSYFHEVKNSPYFLDDTRVGLPDDFYMTEAYTDHAVRFTEEALALRDTQGRPVPFFLYLAHIAPHWPLHAREADIAPHRERYRHTGWNEWRKRRFDRQQTLGLVSSDQKIADWPAEVQAWQDDELAAWQAERMAVYSAMVASVDRSVGRVLDVIDKARQRDNTLVIFVSDNGAAPDGGTLPTDRGFGFDADKPNDDWRLDGSPIRAGSGPDHMPGPANTFAGYGRAWCGVSNTPWRGTKSTAYEGGIRAPLIVSWPAGIHRDGQIVTDVSHLFDLTSTFLDAAGTTYPDQWQGRTLLPQDGRSLLPALTGQPEAGASTGGPRELYWRAPQNRAARVGDWKLVESLDPKGTWELYDLANDPGETRNLAAAKPELVREFTAKWDQWHARCQGK